MSRSSARVAKRKRDEEETYYRAKIRADPKDASAHYDLARVLMARGDMTGAEEGYRAPSAVSYTHLTLPTILLV